MSRSLLVKAGSLDSLNRCTRCGCRPCARQIRCTELMLMPTTLAIAAAVQCVASLGGSLLVSVTTRSITEVASGGFREGRVLSRRSPSTPSSMKRFCQRHTQVLSLPVSRSIPLVPTPLPVRRMIRARQTCFCGRLRSATIASRQARAAASTVKAIFLRITQTRTPSGPRESTIGVDR